MSSTETELAVVSSETGFRDAARILLQSAFLKMMKSAAETRSGLLRREPTPTEIEALHDMRVGSRRLRAALSLFASIFPKNEYQDLEEDISRITTALATVRDLDVQREIMATIRAKLPENEAYGIERLRSRLAKQRDKEREELVKALNKLEKSRFEKRFAQALDRSTSRRGKKA